MSEQQWWFTFGADDTHPITGTSLAGQFIVLNGDRETARLEACRRFGDQWDAQHDNADAVAGLREPEPPELMAGAIGPRAEANAITYASYRGRPT